MFGRSPTAPGADRRAEYRFGDDTTTVFAPSSLTVALAPEADQPASQDTATFVVRDADGAVAFEVTASHFSSGDRAANMEKFREIVTARCADASHPQIVMGDINTEVRTSDALQQLADDTGLVVMVPSLRIRRLRGLQDQLHKRMDRKDDHDSMFVAADPALVDAEELAEVAHQNVAWPGRPERLRWKTPGPEDVAQAWADDRILTDHGVVVCPLVGGEVVSLGNVARANYDKYDITNEAQVDRHTYLAGQQVIETEVASAVIDLVSGLPASDTLDADTKAAVVADLTAYREDLGALYATAFRVWDDGDDLCSEDTPLGAAMLALGQHAKRFVSIVRRLHWQDLEAAPEARAAFTDRLTEALVEGLGLGASDGPLAGHPGFDADAFRAKSRATIEAAWKRILTRQSAGDLYKMWFAELLRGQTTGGMPIPASVFAQSTVAYVDGRMRDLGLEGTLCVVVEALR